jgi:hypothetical protein
MNYSLLETAVFFFFCLFSSWPSGQFWEWMR